MTGCVPQPPGHERLVIREHWTDQARIRCNCGFDTGPGLRPRAEVETEYDGHLIELGLDHYLPRTA